MNKFFVVIYFALGLPMLVKSQCLVSKKIYSSAVNDSVAIKIWLPKDYSTAKHYPTIYEFIYDHSNYIAATASNIWDIPNVIVVFAQIEGGNDHYSNPGLTDRGQKYYSFIKNELISYVTKEYNTAKFNVAAGLSQGADYINYILRNDPQLFNAYLAFSIESPINYTPDLLSYTAKISDSLSYFIAVADDEERRIKFASQLYDSLRISPYINIKKEVYSRASHSYSILYALPDALLYAFRDYTVVISKNAGESLIAYYTSSLKEKKEKFGQVSFHQFIIQVMYAANMQEASINQINDFIDTVYTLPETMDIDLVNMGSVLRSKKLYENAIKAFRMALSKKQETGITAMDNLSMYFQLYKAYDLNGNTADALKILQEGYEKTKSKDEGLLYTMAYYYIDKKIDIKKGIEILTSLLENKHNVSARWSKPADQVYAEVAAGYWALKNKTLAKSFVNKSLQLNPKNEHSLKLKLLL